MLNRTRLARASSAAILALTLALAGCGTDEETFSERTSPSTPPAEGARTPVVDSSAPAPEIAVTPQPAADVTYETCETAFLEGRYDEAVDLFTAYTKRRGSNPWGHYMLGMSAWKSGRLEAAEAAFKHAIELDSTLVKGHLNLARVLIECNRPTEAVVTIDRVIAIDGESSVAFRLQGRALHTLGQSVDALAAYRRAIQIDPEDAWSMNNLAFILIEQGRYDEALPALARATELRKDVAVFFNNLGMVLEQVGQFRAAEEAYTLSASLDGVSPKAIANRDRIAGVKERPGTPSLNLAALAREFASGIEDGSLATAARATLESTPAAGASDTTASDPRLR